MGSCPRGVMQHPRPFLTVSSYQRQGFFTHALPRYMQLQSRRVRSLEFLPVAVLEVRSPSAIPFRMHGWVIQLAKASCQLWITLKPFAVDDDPIQMLVVGSAWRIRLVHGNTFHTEFLRRNTVLFFSFFFSYEFVMYIYQIYTHRMSKQRKLVQSSPDKKKKRSYIKQHYRQGIYKKGETVVKVLRQLVP